MIRSALSLIVISLLTLAACDRSKGEKQAAEKEEPTVSAAKTSDEANAKEETTEQEASPAKEEAAAEDSDEAADEDPGDEYDESGEE